MTIVRPTIIARTKQRVVEEISTQPYVGFEHLTDVPDGWKYDIKRWSSPFDLRLPILPKLTDEDIQGVPESYYKPGVSDSLTEDIVLKQVVQLSGLKTNQWIPEISSGDYYRYDTNYHLFSDNSIVESISSDNNVDGRNTITLLKEPKLDSEILAATFKRDRTANSIVYHKKINKVNAFTGIYVDGVEQETVNSVKTITWSNVDTTKREFFYSYPNKDTHVLLFNRDYIEQHGVVPTVYLDLGACEFLGSSNGEMYQVFTLNYFPVVPDDFQLYIAETSTYDDTWVRVETWKEMESTSGKKYFLDKDLGIVYFGGSNCTIPALNEKIIATYKSTLRIEYEEETTKTLSTLAWEADTNPITQATSQGFVCITHDLLEAANITLAVNKELVPDSSPEYYGPVYAGTDYAVFTAKVFDANGNPVPGKQVNFEMTPINMGALNNNIRSSSATNSLGKAYTNYQPPTTSDDLGWFSKTVRTSTDYPGKKEVIINIPDMSLSGQEEKVYLYHILRDDPVLGYYDLDEYLDNLPKPAWVSSPYYEEQWKAEVILKYNLTSWPAADPDEGTSVPGRKVILYRIDYDDNIENDLDHSANVISPITGIAGAGTNRDPWVVMPVFPEVAEKIPNTDPDPSVRGMWRLVYPEEAVPDINFVSAYPEVSPPNSIAGYWVVSDRLITVRASCWSEYYNRTIYSQPITINVSIPDYMLGVYVRDDLKKSPIGWKIKGTDIVSSMLNTSTFITINPYSGPYEIIDLVNQESTNTWASAPFRTVNFIFEVKEP
jgi:hypothetical protein